MTPEERCWKNYLAWERKQPDAIVWPLAEGKRLKTERDRIWLVLGATEFRALQRALKTGNFTPGSYKLHGPSAFESYREKVPFASVQITFHDTLDAVKMFGSTLEDAERIVEWDVDFGNPGWGDLATLGAHALEVLKNKLFRRKTNPFIIAKLFERRGIIEKEGQA